MKEFSLFELVGTLIALAVVAYAVKLFIDKQKEKGVSDLAVNSAVTSTGGKVIAAKVPISDIPKAKLDLLSYDLKTPSEMIYKSKGVFKDDPDNVYQAFRMFKNQIHLVTAADYFKRAYNSELYSYLSSFLDTAEMNNVNKIVSNLKAY